MKTRLYLGIAVRIIALFGVGMLMSSFNPYLHELFGDVKLHKMSDHALDPWWKWSTMHYWYAWMIFMLFILSLINLIISVVNLVNKHYPNTI
jgi:hypothetical protein